MAKMYLSEEEACQALGVDLDGLMEFVNSGKLQMYQDGAKHVYKAGDIETLAQETGAAGAPADQGEDLELPPAEDQSAQEDFTAASAEDSLEAALETPGSEEDIALLDDSGEQTEGSTGMMSPEHETHVGDQAEDELSLADETQALAAPTEQSQKEDTVITSEGISIFDDEDLEIEEADPMAKTQIAPSLDDQIALDGVGSGSGLLDLTRESDDTSLGAEVLDQIDMEGSGLAGSGLAGSGLAGGTELAGSGLSGTGMGTGLTDTALSSGLESVAGTDTSTPTVATTPSAGGVAAPTYVEAVDPASGLFGGMLLGAAIVMLVVLFATVAAQQGIVSGLMENLQKSMGILLAAMVVVIGICAAAGHFIAKAFAGKATR
jgi:hypothetical protein